MSPGGSGDADRGNVWVRLRSAGIVPRATVILVGVPVLAAAAVLGGIAFRLLVGLLVVLGVREFLQLMAAKGYGPFKALGTAAALVCAAAVAQGGDAAIGALTGVMLVVMTVELLRRNMRRSLSHIAVTLLGALYVGWLAGYFVLLREMGGGRPGGEDLGLRALGLLAATTWCCDILAYLVGVTLGRRPLLPRVSPRKSVEGAVGGMLGATGAGWAAAATFAPFVTSWQGALIGLGCGVAGQLGDLVESMLKRDAGIKDTAGLLPGHGGVLDRFDSLLFNAPLVYYALVLIRV